MSAEALTHLSISVLFEMFVMSAMYLMMILEASVFPAPLSPREEEEERKEGEGRMGK